MFWHALAYFVLKKGHFKPKFDMFLTFMLIKFNLNAQKL